MSTLNVPSLEMTLGSATGNPKNKVALKKGRGLMDWVRLGNTNKDLAGTAGRILKVTSDELAKHNKRDDAWIALNGKVYNITPYFEYHPGGEDELLRGAGIDATNLFNEVHKWVNYESLLKKCLIGSFVQSVSIFRRIKYLPKLKNKSTSNATMKPHAAAPLCIPSFPRLNLDMPSPPMIGGRMIFEPKYDWFQTDSTVNIAIYTKCINISHRHVIVIHKEQMIKIYTYINTYIYIVNVELYKSVEKAADVQVNSETGKVDVIFKKVDSNTRWNTLGTPQFSNGQITGINDIKMDYYSFKIITRTKVTHDTYLFELESADVVYFGVPIGFHIFLGLPDIDTRRPYTPIDYPVSQNGSQNYKSVKLFIKIYPNGILTPKIANLCESDSLEVGIPQGSFATIHQQHISKMGNLLLLAAGTGITPFLALISYCLNINISIKLLFFNKTEEDIPWKKDFEKLEESTNFSVTHVLSRPHEDWNGAKGRVTRKLIQEELSNVGEFVCICGPKEFNDICVKLLKELDVTEDKIHSFLG